MTRPSAGEARLVAACARGGCPVCRCLADDSARHLAAILHEHVTDLEVRSALRGSRGFCNWHAALLQGLPGAAFGSAIVSADLLARERARAQAGRGGRRRLTGLVALRAWLGRPTRGRAAPARASCFVCEALHAGERRYLEALVAIVDDTRFLEAFELADGLCAPHLAQLVEQEGPPGRDDAVARVVALTCERWRRVESALSRFIAKHEHRQHRPFTEEEGRAWRLALELLSGAPGVFGNALHPPRPSGGRGARRPRPAGLGRGRG